MCIVWMILMACFLLIFIYIFRMGRWQTATHTIHKWIAQCFKTRPEMICVNPKDDNQWKFVRINLSFALAFAAFLHSHSVCRSLPFVQSVALSVRLVNSMKSILIHIYFCVVSDSFLVYCSPIWHMSVMLFISLKMEYTIDDDHNGTTTQTNKQTKNTT